VLAKYGDRVRQTTVACSNSGMRLTVASDTPESLQDTHHSSSVAGLHWHTTNTARHKDLRSHAPQDSSLLFVSSLFKPGTQEVVPGVRDPGHTNIIIHFE
jgi:hypothetical protein